jgi:hypothetical protein
MDTLDCWVSGKKLAVWISTSTQFEPVVHVQANKAALESLANVLRKLAASAQGTAAMLDTQMGLDDGDAALSLEHADRLSAPMQMDLAETRVTPPEEGDAVLWGRVPDDKREEVVALMVVEGNYTTRQAREAIVRGGTFASRLNADVAVRLRDSLRRLGVDCALFELRS